MMPTDFQRNHVLDMLAREFPEISGLEVQHFSPSMRPITYHDGFRERQEVPPIFWWRVGSKRHAFAPRPSFRRVTVRGWWPLSSPRQGLEPHYGDAELDALRDAIRSTVADPILSQET